MDEARTARQSEPVVCVVGAGWSGLAACRALQRRDIPFTCLERDRQVGGMWQWVGCAAPGPGYAALHLNTSKRMTAFADLPMPVHYPVFPDHRQVAEYLRQYAEQTGLRDTMEFSAQALEVCRRGGRWQVRVRDSRGSVTERLFEHVVIATGHHQIPRSPEPDPAGGGFTGQSLHAADYHDNRAMAGRRVLVVGFGASAADIVVDISRVAAATLLSVRRGLHVTPKRLFGIPIDEIPGMAWWQEMSFAEQRRLMEMVLWLTRGTMADFGLPEPDHPLFSSALTISDDLLTRISHGYVQPRPAVAAFDGPRVHFTDGSAAEVDVIVYCTGYDPDFGLLGPSAPTDRACRIRLYLRVVAPEAPGLAFLGLIRPVGALTRLLEQQAAWLAAVISRAVQLPSPARMNEEIDTYLAEIAARYGSDPRHTVQVDFAPYTAALATP